MTVWAFGASERLVPVFSVGSKSYRLKGSVVVDF